ncbi:formimidoyltransferase-cyclodeaminase [Procambarus clarkii]|uniref:formimidoyltransferase-cyclodeaminase n=1 Tax=Procambarus clarkii TaxID=6728 RepID=UPI001E676371|nr:formimidoyltransferase-cyclodeaminase-like [Procambarus clarkii]
MSKIIECVPNFSEGRDKAVIEEIATAIRETPGATLLDVDPGHSTNRTVYTFVGNPADVVEAALNASKVAYKLIDMTKHKGEHPRMGALDVCPFIPVRGVTEEECVVVAKTFGARLAQELGVPVFLYGAASSSDYRRTMPQIRAGEYEGMKDKLQKPEWAPDFGDPNWVPRWGASVTGVRKFLIAYNVNMVATKEQAHRIALNLRDQGRGPEQPGRLRCCQAIGWYLQEQNIAQISINLTDFEVTPIHVAYEEAKKDAEDMKLAVTGSEIVGLVPLEALLMAADYYIQKENLFILEEDQKVHLAINRLGLSTISPFKPKERVIEYCLENSGTGELAGGSVEGFIRSVASRSPAPGGGSVAAVVAALGAALGAMVGQLTYGKRQWESLDATIRRVLPPLHQAAVSLIPAIDADTAAFNKYMAATKLPQKTDEERAAREAAMAAATEETIQVPLSLLRKVNAGTWEALTQLADVGNINCRSDLQVGARCLEAGAWGAFYNVQINLNNITDEATRARYLREADDLLQQARKGCSNVLEAVDKRQK